MLNKKAEKPLQKRCWKESVRGIFVFYPSRFHIKKPRMLKKDYSKFLNKTVPLCEYVIVCLRELVCLWVSVPVFSLQNVWMNVLLGDDKSSSTKLSLNKAARGQNTFRWIDRPCIYTQQKFDNNLTPIIQSVLTDGKQLFCQSVFSYLTISTLFLSFIFLLFSLLVMKITL